MRSRLLPILSLLLAFGLSSCVQDVQVVQHIDYTADEFAIISQKLNLSGERDRYSVFLSQHMMNSGMVSPSINDAKATLGRVLFFDTQLSRNNTVSCESCHKQALAFSDDVALSDGFDGEKTLRNSLALGAVANFESSYDGSTNSSIQGNIGFFWDERAHSIAQQSTMTIQDDIEMGMDLNDLAQRLSGIDYYRVLFDKAFHDQNVTPERITGALQEFINAFISSQSKFDKGLDENQNLFGDFRNFSAVENAGKAIFQENCSSCHGFDMSNPVMSIANNGLDVVYDDKGVGQRDNNPNMDGVFKVPFLRNVALTGPYMHDGRFATLEEVVDHYSEGIASHQNLAFQLRDPANSGEAIKMNFTAQEKEQLITFLHTLTDYDFINDPRFSDPFNP